MFEGLVEQVEVVEVVDSIFLCKRGGGVKAQKVKVFISLENTLRS